MPLSWQHGHPSMHSSVGLCSKATEWLFPTAGAFASWEQLFSVHVLVREDVRSLAPVSFPVGRNLAERETVSTFKL